MRMKMARELKRVVRSAGRVYLATWRTTGYTYAQVRAREVPRYVRVVEYRPAFSFYSPRSTDLASMLHTKA